jgi:hypothetical protein
MHEEFYRKDKSGVTMEQCFSSYGFSGMLKMMELRIMEKLNKTGRVWIC